MSTIANAVRQVRHAWHEAVADLTPEQLIEVIDQIVADLEGYREGAEYESDDFEE